MDDVLIYGANEAEHNSQLTAIMEHLEAAGVTLNPDKCEFSKMAEKFHQIMSLATPFSSRQTIRSRY